MPYTTFAEVKEKVRGPAVLRDLLRGHSADIAALNDDDAPHPFFDKQVAIADGRINDKLDAAGLEWPIADPSDERLRLAATCIVIGLLAEAASNQEQWTKELAAVGEEYLTELAGGTITVIGAEESPDVGASGVTGRRVDVPEFDTGPYDYSLMDTLMPPLGRDPRLWRR